VQQFFEHGGSRLFVVRVANSARGAMICLPAVGGVLVLRAVEPGSTEHIRAAVDYDRIDANDEDRFNLTVQRIAPDTGLVVDQEIFRRVTCKEGERDFVEDALLSSTLIRAQTPLPAGRPVATEQSYAEHAQRGNDGAQISDYDLVGSTRYLARPRFLLRNFTVDAAVRCLSWIRQPIGVMRGARSQVSGRRAMPVPTFLRTTRASSRARTQVLLHGLPAGR